MNALRPTRLLRVAEDAAPSDDHIDILGRGIRTSSERIARYWVMRHEPIYEDLATLVESMAYWDRLITRNRVMNAACALRNHHSSANGRHAGPNAP